MTADKDLIPLAELPARLNRSEGTIARWIRTGALPSVTVPGTTCVHRSVIDEMVGRRHLGAEIKAIEDVGGEPFSAEQIALITRAFGDALARLGTSPRAS